VYSLKKSRLPKYSWQYVSLPRAFPFWVETRPCGCKHHRIHTHRQLRRVNAMQPHLQLQFIVSQGRQSVAVINAYEAGGDRVTVGSMGRK
jgi:hypothetical protein